MNVKQLMTAQDVLDLLEKPGYTFKLINGVPREVPGATMLHGLIAVAV